MNPFIANLEPRYHHFAPAFGYLSPPYTYPTCTPALNLESKHEALIRYNSSHIHGTSILVRAPISCVLAHHNPLDILNITPVAFPDTQDLHWPRSTFGIQGLFSHHLCPHQRTTGRLSHTTFACAGYGLA